MRFDVLGPLRVSGPDGPVPVPPGRPTAALCWLVLHANENVALESFASVMWAQPPGAAVTKVRAILRGLAVLFGSDAIEIGTQARLVVAPDAIDARRFERLIRDAAGLRSAGDEVRARASLQDALALWRGDPYPELDRAVSAMGAIDKLLDLRLDAVEALMGLTLRHEVDYTVVAELRSLTILYPDRVVLRRLLALALYLTDRQIESLDVLRDARNDLGDEDGSVAELQAAILKHDPALVPAKAATPLT